ncbi:proline-rich protein 2-like isoform X2 [Penaeus indicus]|uniref:proline-rich protein 2-like isoform X2 n=1 Tax=Penaeus indicus TaxID=29960 RepID=UPI00300D7A8C
MNTNAAPVVAQSVTVVRPNSSFDCSNMIYTITKVAAVIIISGFGGVLLLLGVVLYSADDFFQTNSIIMIVFGMGLITIAIIICAKGKPCRGNSSGRIIQRNNATPQVVTQHLPATVQYPTTGYVAVTSQTYSPGVAGQAAAPSAFPAPAGGFSANYTYTSGDGKGPLPAYPASTAGTYPHGAYPLGQNQGDAYPPGQHPPGLYSPGVYQPGAPPAGPYQPGAPPAGPYQPGAPPAGPYPPSNTSAPPAVPNLTAPEYQPPPPFAPTEKPPPYSY